MAKYDEIMEHIEVSDEMNSRVLKNIEAHFEKEDAPSTSRKEPSTAASRNGSNKIVPKWMVSIGVMAALTMLCIYPLMKLITVKHEDIEYQATQQGNQNTKEDYDYPNEKAEEEAEEEASAGEDTHVYIVPKGDESGPYEVESIDELSEAVGFTVPEVEEIPFEVIDVRCSADDDSVYIVYIGEGNKRLYFDMSREKERFSGGYLGLEYNKTVKILSLDVTLEGFIFEGFFAASWTDADFGYALQISGGNDEDSLLRMVESVIRNQQN